MIRNFEWFGDIALDSCGCRGIQFGDNADAIGCSDIAVIQSMGRFTYKEKGFVRICKICRIQQNISGRFLQGEAEIRSIGRKSAFHFAFYHAYIDHINDIPCVFRGDLPAQERFVIGFGIVTIKPIQIGIICSYTAAGSRKSCDNDQKTGQYFRPKVMGKFCHLLASFSILYPSPQTTFR